MTDSGTGNTAGARSTATRTIARGSSSTGAATYSRTTSSDGNHAFKFGWLSEWEMQGFTDYGFVDNLSLTFNSAAGVARLHDAATRRDPQHATGTRSTSSGTTART